MQASSSREAPAHEGLQLTGRHPLENFGRSGKIWKIACPYVHNFLIYEQIINKWAGPPRRSQFIHNSNYEQNINKWALKKDGPNVHNLLINFFSENY